MNDNQTSTEKIGYVQHTFIDNNYIKTIFINLEIYRAICWELPQAIKIYYKWTNASGTLNRIKKDTEIAFNYIKK